MDKIAVYPGSFDPVTNGHLDIIKRASYIFDELIVAVFNNPNKNPTFSMEERVELMQKVAGDIPGVRIDYFSGLLNEYAVQKNARNIVRGLRALSDFEKEFQQALMYKKLNPDLEIMFLMTSQEYGFLSSSLVKEIASLGGCIDGLVPDPVKEFLLKYYKKQKQKK